MSRDKRFKYQSQHQRTSVRDSIRLLLAIVFILFAAIASRNHDAPETILETNIETQELAQSQTPRPRIREEKRSPKIPEASLFSRINGAI